MGRAQRLTPPFARPRPWADQPAAAVVPRFLATVLGACLALTSLAPASAAPDDIESEPEPVLTPLEDIAALLTDAHPRLMVDDVALAGILSRTSTDELSAELYADLLAHPSDAVTLISMFNM